MPLLLDSDALCKLMAMGLFESALAVLGFRQNECLRLPSLHHMLRRGHLRNWLGDTIADRILPGVVNLAVLPEAPEAWLELVVNVTDIDPGEAQLFSVAAGQDAVLLTGDKRALVAVRGIARMQEALDNKVVPFETVLLRLCGTLGRERIKEAAMPARDLDVVLRVAFSEENQDPEAALESYLRDLENMVRPLRLRGA